MNVKIRFIGIPLLIGLIVSMFGCAAPPPQNCALPATGQADWYRNNGNIANCDDFTGFNNPLDVPPGQDGRFMAGCPTEEGRFVVDGQVITDNCTGLMWQRTPQGGTMSWIDALVFARDLTLAGFSDWRLPNVNELLSIVDYGRYPDFNVPPKAINPVFDIPVGDDVSAIDPTFFWSSTSYVATPQSEAWRVNFARGGLELRSKNYSSAVRAVRGGFIPFRLPVLPCQGEVVSPP